MDIHRIRFVPLPAPEIHTLAFSHTSRPEEPTPPQLRLALGRSNGDIEIWNPMSRATGATAAKSESIDAPGTGATWSQETILRGGKDRTIEGLTWTQDLEGETAAGKKTPGKLRLFSIGYSPNVTEWDLASGRSLRQTPAGQADVWCMAAQPRWNVNVKQKSKGKQGDEATAIDPVAEQLLALGCQDGSIVLMSTADGDLTYLKTLPRNSGRKSSVVSLAWYGRDKIVAGCSDSMIRVYEVKSPRGSLITQMSLGGGGKGAPRETLVWSVKVLRDDTIVSGDSTGEIKIWDAKNYTLSQRLQSHLADVLSLAVNHDGTLLLSGGMDRRTTLYQRAASERKGGKGRWAAVSHQRNHKADVNAMATFESKQMSVVVSGGRDATPIVNPLRTFGQENHRSLPPFPSTPQIYSAPKGRLLVSFWDSEVSIWRIEPRIQTEDEEDVETNAESTMRKLVARIAVQGEESITSVSISHSGDIVAIATLAGLKLFHLRPRKAAPTYRITKIELPQSAASTGAKLIRFSPDGKWLVTTPSDNSVRLHRLAHDQDTKLPWKMLDVVVDFDRRHGSASQRAVWGTHEKYDHVISTFAWSSDSRILVAGDISGNLDTWVLEGTEDLDWPAAPTTNGVDRINGHVDGESSDEESEDEDHSKVIYGQHWRRHTETLPRLPAAPVVLSFRQSTSSQATTEDANIGLHATRHNPAPHSHQLSHGEDRLIAVTARQDVLEFSALGGKLTDWAKRNPPSTFPLEFRNVLDQATDCLWDSKDGRTRLWLYGSTWLWMFDLSRDFPATEDAPAPSSEVVLFDEKTRKRKREEDAAETRNLIKQNAGAGSKIPDEQLVAGTGLRVRTYKGNQATGEDSNETVFQAPRISKKVQEDSNESQDDENVEDEGEDIDSDDEDNQKLVAIRRKDSMTNGQEHDRDEDDANQPPHFWHTFKYRPIIGIVPLERGCEEDESAAPERRNLEIALVERPLWDANLKPRWEGPQDR